MKNFFNYLKIGGLQFLGAGILLISFILLAGVELTTPLLYTSFILSVSGATFGMIGTVGSIAMDFTNSNKKDLNKDKENFDEFKKYLIENPKNMNYEQESNQNANVINASSLKDKDTPEIINLILQTARQDVNRRKNLKIIQEYNQPKENVESEDLEQTLQK